MSCATFNITLATSESTAFPLDGTVPLQVVVERTSFDLEMLSTGPRGTSATVAVGSVSASAPGSQPSVTNSGTPLMAVLDFVLPRGDAGPQGIQGVQGPVGPIGQTGPSGPAATVAVGSTTTSAAGSSAAVSNSGTTSAAVFNFVIPRGDKGETGPTGTAATISVGSTTTGAAGTSASVSNSGTTSAAVFNFTVPRGDKGDTGQTGPQGPIGLQGPSGSAATVAVGSTTTGAAGSSASVTNAGSSFDAVLNFTIPRGDTGATGSAGPQGPQGPVGPGYSATSTTAMTAGNGSKTFTTQSGLAYLPGSYVKVVSASSPSDSMTGSVTSYSGTTLVVQVNGYTSTGQSKSDWNISITGTDGVSPTVSVGSVATTLPGGSASVTNVGSPYAAVFNFGIPQGSTGPTGPGYLATSSTATVSASGQKAFTTQSGLAYVTGSYIKITSASSPSDWMAGTVTTYVFGGIVVDVTSFSTTGQSRNDWRISLSGEKGDTGATGATGPAGPTGAGGALGHYGTFSDSTTQTVASTTSAYTVTLNSTDESNGISRGTPTSRIIVSHAGTYNVQWSAQFENSSVSEQDVRLWIRKNGADVVGSSGIIAVPSSHGGVNGHAVSGWNYVLTLLANDYIELVWQSSSTDVKMAYYAAGSSPTSPSAASIIVTVTQVMYTQASEIPSGTGLVSVTGGAYDTPLTLSARVASDASNLRTQLGLGSLATQSSVAYSSLTGTPSSFTPSTHASSHDSGGSDPVTLAQSQITNLTTDLSAKAPLASPALTGTPTAPTATSGTNTTQIATTAFVTAAVAAGGGSSSSTIAVMKFLE